MLTSGISAIRLGNALATRQVTVRLPNNTATQLIRRLGRNDRDASGAHRAGAPITRRTSWRELITQ